MAPGQGVRLLGAAMKILKEGKARDDAKYKQWQAKEKAKDMAKAAKRRTKEMVDEGAGLYYDQIQEVDPNLVSGRVGQDERPTMKSLFKECATDEDGSEQSEAEREEHRGQSNHGSNLLQSANSVAEELDPHPPRGRNGSSEQVAKFS